MYHNLSKWKFLPVCDMPSHMPGHHMTGQTRLWKGLVRRKRLERNSQTALCVQRSNIKEGRVVQSFVWEKR